jgi:hypothetical protein
MTKAEKNHLIKWNSICWIAAMVLPSVLHLALGDTKFPWPLMLPFLYFGFSMASNNMLSKAIGKATDE